MARRRASAVPRERVGPWGLPATPPPTRDPSTLLALRAREGWGAVSQDHAKPPPPRRRAAPRRSRGAKGVQRPPQLFHALVRANARLCSALILRLLDHRSRRGPRRLQALWLGSPRACCSSALPLSLGGEGPCPRPALVRIEKVHVVFVLALAIPGLRRAGRHEIARILQPCGTSGRRMRAGVSWRQRRPTSFTTSANSRKSRFATSNARADCGTSEVRLHSRARPGEWGSGARAGADRLLHLMDPSGPGAPPGHDAVLGSATPATVAQGRGTGRGGDEPGVGGPGIRRSGAVVLLGTNRIAAMRRAR